MDPTTYALSLLAGALSILSPCVLPLLPIVLGTAGGAHRFGPAALAGGLAVSFALSGTIIAAAAVSLGLSGDVFRSVGAVVLIAFGLLLLAPAAQLRLAVAAGALTQGLNDRVAGARFDGLGGQAALGMLLGLVWAPCVGPTLGAATALAGRGEGLGQAASVMLAFGVGAALPLLLLGFAGREAMLRWRGRLAGAGARGKMALGLALVSVGVLVLTGLDKRLEAALLDVAPEWLIDLTTSI